MSASTGSDPTPAPLNASAVLLSERRRLDPPTLEDALARSRPWTTDHLGRIVLAPASAGGLRFDCCAVEWLDLAGTAQLVSLADAALREGVPVEVVLPLPRLRANERAWLDTGPAEYLVEQLGRRVERRRRAARMFDLLDVQGALSESATRWGEPARLRVVSNFDTTRPDAETFVQDAADLPADADDGALGRRARSFRFMSTLRWLRFEQRDDVERFAKDIVALMLDPERSALHPVDVGALTNAVFHELLENVEVHAGSTKHAVVVAWVRPTSERMVEATHLAHERGYVEWVRTLRVPVLDLVIADSGEGVHRSLEKSFSRNARRDANVAALPPGDAQVLAWAWDRWSTSHEAGARRGTRGLYRVDRVARRHYGLAMLRAGTQSVGWDHGGPSHNRLLFSAAPLAPAPGTVVRLLLPTAPVERVPPRVAEGPPPEGVTVRWAALGAFGPGGLNDGQLQTLQDEAGADEAGKPVCVVGQFDPAPPGTDLTEAVIALAQDAHPLLTVAFGLSDDAAALREAVDGSRHQAEWRRLFDDTRAPDATDVGSPLLVVLPDGSAEWAGVPPAFARVLDHMLRKPDVPLTQEALGELLAGEIEGELDAETDRDALRRRIHRYLIDAHSLARVGPDGSASLLLTLSGLVAALRERVGDFVREAIRLNGDRPVRTPTLRLTRAWVSPGALWRSVRGDHPGLFALGAMARARRRWAELSDATLVVDSGTPATTAARLRRYLGCARLVRLPHYAELALPPGVPLLTRPGPVVVYCDVVSSGESVRRSLKQVLRDGGEPLAVLCTVDGRSEASDRIKGPDDQRYLLLSLVRDVPLLPPGMTEEEALGGPDAVALANCPAISPLTGQPEPPEVDAPAGVGPVGASDPATPSPDVLRDLIDAKGLHFTHVARPNGRHFTLWVDTHALVRLDSVRSGLKNAIDAWLREQNELGEGAPIALWFPVTEGTDPTALRTLGRWLAAQYGERCRPVEVHRAAAYGRWAFPSAADLGPSRPLVVVVDTSSVEGGTLEALVRLAAECGARSVLACLPLCQLPAEQRAFLESLSAVHADALPPQSPGQGELALGLTQPPQRVPHTAKVQVRFLSQLPSAAFSLEACPLCSQRRQIEAFRPTNTDLLDLREEIVNDRLRPRDAREIISGDPRGLLGAPLGVEELAALLAWRRCLAASLTSSRARWRTLAEVQGALAADLARDAAAAGTAAGATPEPRVRLRALLHLVAVESQWLRLPPFEFAVMRDLVSQIARRLIADAGEVTAVKLHALTTLRLAQTHKFMDAADDVLAMVAGEAQLEEELLFNIYTFLERPYQSVAGTVDRLAGALARLGDGGDGALVLASEAAPSLLRHLAGRAAARRIEVHSRVLDAPQAATRLAKALGQLPRFVAEAFARMSPESAGNLALLVDDQTQDGGSDQLSPRAETWIRELPDRLETVRQWVREELVTNLRPLEELLRHADSGLAERERARLSQILDGAQAPDGAPFFQAASAIARKGDIPAHADWQPYRIGYEWLAEHVFRAASGTDGPAAESAILRWLGTFPARLADVATRVRTRLADEERLCEVYADEKEGTLPPLFAPQKLLNVAFVDFVWELVRDLPRNAVFEVRFAPGREDRRRVEFELRVIPAEGAGEAVGGDRPAALRRLNDKLRCVGATVAPLRDPATGAWRFECSFQRPSQAG